MNKQCKNKFNFFAPATFEKGQKNGAAVVRIKGVASTASAVDSDGETLFPEGFDYTPLLERGYLNWDHQTKNRASAIVGEPDVAKVINDGKDFYIEGFLYSDSEDAQDVAKLAKVLEKNSKTRRLGYSIEGQVIERDPMNPKKILKARITGIAITPQPKNPNTILSLMKGEYADAYVDEDFEHDEEIIKAYETVELNKAMTAEGASEAGVLPEDIEGFKNPNKIPLDDKKKKLRTCPYCDHDQVTEDDKCLNCGKTVGRSVKKSEIYNLIADNYTTDVVKAKRIYSLIETVNEKMFNMTNEITMEAVNKAFEVLNKAAENDISKSNTVETEEKVETKDTELAKVDSIKKGEDGDDLDKAKKMCKSLFDKGLTKGAAIDEMVKGGFSLEVSTGAADQVASEMSNLKENGGTVTTVSPAEQNSGHMPLSKSEVEDLLKSVVGETNELIKSVSTSQDRKFEAVGKILQAQIQQNDLLKGELNTLKTSNESLKKDIETIGSQAQPVKSATKVAHVERFQKAEENQISGENVFNIRKAEDRESLLELMDAEVQVARNAGRRPSQLLETAIGDLEICKSMSAQAVSYLKAKGITVVGK